MALVTGDTILRLKGQRSRSLGHSKLRRKMLCNTKTEVV